MHALVFTSSFCAPCHQALEVFAEAQRLVPQATVSELNVASHTVEAVAYDIRSTPTVVVLNAADEVVFRSEGAPTVPQALAALALAL